jgi:hypothetical protein
MLKLDAFVALHKYSPGITFNDDTLLQLAPIGQLLQKKSKVLLDREFSGSFLESKCDNNLMPWKVFGGH